MITVTEVEAGAKAEAKVAVEMEELYLIHKRRYYLTVHYVLIIHMIRHEL